MNAAMIVMQYPAVESVLEMQLAQRDEEIQALPASRRLFFKKVRIKRAFCVDKPVVGTIRVCTVWPPSDVMVESAALLLQVFYSQLKPGEYKVEMVGDKAVFKIGKSVVEVPATLGKSDQKYSDTALVSQNSKVVEIDLGGTTTKILFSPAAQQHSAAGE